MRLGDAVRVDEEAVARMHFKGAVFILRASDRADDPAMLVFQQLKGSARAPDGRMLVPRVAGQAFAGGELDHGQPDRDEGRRVVFLTEPEIDTLQRRGGIQAAQKMAFDAGLGRHHEQRGWNPLAGDVRDHEREAVSADQEEIVEVAADLHGGSHGCEQIKFLPLREGREFPRQR